MINNSRVKLIRRKILPLISFFSFVKIHEVYGSIFSKKALRILLITDGLVLISGAMLGPIYAIYVDIVGVDLMDASIAGGIFALVAGFTVFVSGKFSDHVNEPKYIVSLGYTIIGFGFLLYILVNSVWFLFIVQAIIGFGEAIYTPAFDALYSKHLDKNEEATEWGGWEAMRYFTASGGAVIGGLVAMNFGFSPLFVIMCLLCFISAIYIFFLPKRTL